MVKPNLFIVGAPKSGTSALYRFLKQHPDIFMPKYKEPHFFSKDLQKESDIFHGFLKHYPFRSEDQYLSLFSGAKDEKIIGDASTHALFSNVAAKEIGTIVGGKCWNTFGQNLCLSDEDLQRAEDGETKNIKCTFCLADECMDIRESMNDKEVHAFGEIWDTHWVPINDKYILHYAINVTDKIKYEDKLNNAEISRILEKD